MYLLVNLEKLLFPISKSLMEVFLLQAISGIGLDLIVLSEVVLISRPNSDPITAIKIIAVVCFRRNSLIEDGFFTHKSITKNIVYNFI